MKILECVPNFSVGSDTKVIGLLLSSIESVDNVKVLHVDSGKSVNRTVVTFAGDPDAVVESAFRAAKQASELIDLSVHKGIHPRIGATDVLPLIPLSKVSVPETIEYARKLAARIGNELSIPVYCYEFASFSEQRKSLASIRAGEYEGLADKLTRDEWKPDYGPAVFNRKAGAIAVGARNLLVAFNVNLNTKDVRTAKAIASEIREKKLTGDFQQKERLLGIHNNSKNQFSGSGNLKSVKAIGWFPDEFNIAQVSMNLTDINITPVHIAFNAVCRKAEEKGVKVTGSELVGLIPLKSMIDAGKYILKLHKKSIRIPEEKIIELAVKFFGLNDLYPFDPHTSIIEYKLKELFNFKGKIEI